MLGYSRARLATSPALGSASICQFPVSNKMDGWRMEIMVETQPQHLCILPSSQKGRKGDRHSRPALLRSRIIPFRVFCALKYKYDGGKEIFFLFFPSLPFLIHLEIFFFLWNWKVSDSDRKYENERFNF